MTTIYRDANDRPADSPLISAIERYEKAGAAFMARGGVDATEEFDSTDRVLCGLLLRDHGGKFSHGGKTYVATEGRGARTFPVCDANH